MGKAKFCSNPEIHQGRGHITKTASRAHPNITENHGTLMFYVKVIYLTIPVVIGKIVAEQTSGTIETEKEMNKLLD